MDNNGQYSKKVLVTDLLIKGAVRGLNPKEINILWSGGKDSTVVLFLLRKLYGGVPFRVTFSDSSLEYGEVYSFIQSVSARWRFTVEVLKFGSARAIAQYDSSGGQKRGILTWERERASRNYIKENGIKLTFSGIRWSEHFHNISRFKRAYAGVTMIYPILHWTKDDIWRFIRENKIPYLPLYDKGFSHVTLRPPPRRKA